MQTHPQHYTIWGYTVAVKKKGNMNITKFMNFMNFFTYGSISSWSEATTRAKVSSVTKDIKVSKVMKRRISMTFSPPLTAFYDQKCPSFMNSDFFLPESLGFQNFYWFRHWWLFSKPFALGTRSVLQQHSVQASYCNW